jgi:N-methylhydantoinase B
VNQAAQFLTATQPVGNRRCLLSKLTMTMRKGDLFRHEAAGAGWDPLERDPSNQRRPERRAAGAG